jgi:hypothetical protein
MTKEDRYAHLGDGIEETTDTADDGADPDEDTNELTVTLDDGTEETVLTFDPEEVSADDLRAAIEAASEGGDQDDADPLLSGDPGRLALELGTLGPRIALKSVESLVDGLQVDRTRNRD